MNDEFDTSGQPDSVQQPQYGYAQQPAAGQQSPYGYAQQPQYGSAYQQAGYTPHPSGQYGYGYAVTNSHGEGGGWITFLRVFLWIWFGLLCLTGIVVFFSCLSQADSVRHWSSAAAGNLTATGTGVLAGCILLAFFSVAGGMVALDAASNIKRCATNSALILEELKKK